MSLSQSPEMFILVCLFVAASEAVPHFGGIPVPGISVPVFRLFDNYAANCRPKKKDDFQMDELVAMLQTLRADDVAQKVYGQLFHSMGDFRVETAMGRWYRVADSRSLHKDDCGVLDFELLSKEEYTAIFTSAEHVYKDGQVVSYHGFGRVMGPDPGQTLLQTGHPLDQCTYFPVKMGGLNLKGDYEYMIWSQPFKYPTMILAKDPEVFAKKYRQEAEQWAERHGFVSPVAALNTRLHFSDPSGCRNAYSYTQH